MALVATSAWPKTGKGLTLLKFRTEVPLPIVPGEIDAELLDDVALHFGDGHLQHDLVAAVHGDAVDDLAAVVDQARGDVEGGLRFDRARSTLPDSTTPSPRPSTWMSAFGSACLIAARRPLRSRVTAMSSPTICWPL